MALLGLGNFRKGTPTEGLNIIMGVEPIKVFVAGSQRSMLTRTWRHVKDYDDYWMTESGTHIYQSWRQLEEAGISLEGLDDQQPEKVWEKAFVLDLDSLDSGEDVPAPRDIRCFTDGSKIDGKTGCGTVIFEDEWGPPVSAAYKGKPSDTVFQICLLYTSPSPRDATLSRMPSSA